jgi:hypothetical protein
MPVPARITLKEASPKIRIVIWLFSANLASA